MYFQIFDRTVKQLVKGMGPEEVAAANLAEEYEAQWGDSRTSSSPHSRACGALRPGCLSVRIPLWRIETYAVDEQIQAPIRSLKPPLKRTSP